MIQFLTPSQKDPFCSVKGLLLMNKRTRFGGQKDSFCKTTKKSIENALTTRANNKQLNINNKG